MSQIGQDKEKKLLQVDSTFDSDPNTDLLMDDNEEYDTNLEDQKKKKKKKKN